MKVMFKKEIRDTLRAKGARTIDDIFYPARFAIPDYFEVVDSGDINYKIILPRDCACMYLRIRHTIPFTFFDFKEDLFEWE
jgi:hypothetical protein